MHPAIRLKYKRYEATIKELKKIIGKRNAMFRRLRKHYERPHTALKIMVEFIELREQWNEKGLDLMDYIILEGIANKNIFYFEDVEQIILQNPFFYESARQDTVRCINRLLKTGYIRTYHKRAIDNYFITTDGKRFLADMGKRVFKAVRGSLK